MPLTPDEIARRHQAELPGPGAYRPLDSLGVGKAVKGGTWNKGAKPMTQNDWNLKRAKDIPGPGESIQLQKFGEKVSGGRFNTAKVMTELEWALKRAQDLPGPGANVLPSTVTQVSGGKFQKGEKPMTEIDWTKKRAAALPDPGTYALPSFVDDIKSNDRGGFGFLGVAKTTPKEKLKAAVRATAAFSIATKEEKIKPSALKFVVSAYMTSATKSPISVADSKQLEENPLADWE